MFVSADSKDLKLIALGCHAVLAGEQNLLVGCVDRVGVAAVIHHAGVGGLVPALLVTRHVSLSALL